MLGSARRLRRRLRKSIEQLSDRQTRVIEREYFLRFKNQYGPLFPQGSNGISGSSKNVLIVSKRLPCLEVELSLIRALEIAGYRPAVLIIGPERILKDYYQLAGVKQILYWGDFIERFQAASEAEKMLDRCGSVEELLRAEQEGTQVGKVAVMTTLRELRTGSLDLSSPETRHAMALQLDVSLAAAKAAHQVIKETQPALVLSADIEYTPQGQLFDACLANGIDVLKYEVAQKPSLLMFKRYDSTNRHQHFSSLDDDSWELVKGMSWTTSQQLELQRELESAYSSGDWYGVYATQFDKKFLRRAEIEKELGLDPSKKTAMIFAHITWDASLMWGKDLFTNYEEWLVETVRSACMNDKVNWVVKIHPANVAKNTKEGFDREPAEVTALRRLGSALPPHIFLLPAESGISTYSLFELMDYCLTVRGTVGIEAASRGIPVLTAGTGRYDHKGFTIDSETPEEYRARLATIQELPMLSDKQRELAERFAYAMFVLRPFALTTATFEFSNYQTMRSDLSKTRVNSNVRGRFNIDRYEDWLEAHDLRRFAEWIDSRKADFITPGKIA